MSEQSESANTEPDSSQAPLSFEAALHDLQEIAGRLEDGTAGLEASLAEFERGVRLLRHCYAQLEQAEQKIEQLVKISETGEAVLAPFDATATPGQPAGKRRTKRSERSQKSSSGQLDLLDDE